MQPITSQQITELTGLRGRSLHDACKDLDIGKTSQGSHRHFAPLDAAALLLATRLNALGLRRVEAFEVAKHAQADLARLLRAPRDARRWLFAHRTTDGAWSIQVLRNVGSPEMFDDEASETFAAVNLRAVVRDVLEIGVP